MSCFSLFFEALIDNIEMLQSWTKVFSIAWELRSFIAYGTAMD